MGWALRVFAFFLALVSFAVGLWPVAGVCFLYLLVSFRPGRSNTEAGTPHQFHVSARYILAGALFVLSGIAFASGGTLSPVLFLAAGAAVTFWPRLLASLPFAQVVPISNSVLLRFRFLPFWWCSVAEFKPSAEAFPRAVSDFTGTLLVFTGTGKAYVLAASRSLCRREAEFEVLSKFRLAAQLVAARLLPLDSETAAGVLGVKLSRTKLPPGDLAESASRVFGALLLECRRGVVRRAANFESGGACLPPAFPAGGDPLEGAPLLWEVLDSMGKKTRWADPDALSDLIDSLAATRGTLLTERIGSMEGVGGRLTIQSLGGDQVCLSRPQLRALIAVYP